MSSKKWADEFPCYLLLIQGCLVQQGNKLNASFSLQSSFSHEGKWFSPQLCNDQLRQQQRLVVSPLCGELIETKHGRWCVSHRISHKVTPHEPKLKKHCLCCQRCSFFLHADTPFGSSDEINATLIYCYLLESCCSRSASLTSCCINSWSFRNVNSWVLF